MKQQTSLDLTPDSNIIDSIRNTKITAPEAVSELVDNSFDAGASEIETTVTPEEITVRDNGRGCDDLGVMLTLGKHKRTSTTRLGRYGVGLKNASIGLGDVLEIDSACDGTRRTATISWNDLAAAGWKSPHGTTETDKAGPVGTVISISQLMRRPQVKPLKEALAFQFAPAIWSGKRILVNGDAIVPWSPALERDPLEFTDEHASGLSYSAEASHTKMNNKGPFILAYEHRIIGQTTEPCREFNASTQFICFVKLKGNWPLLKHKDGLRDTGVTQWLYESLYLNCSDLLEQLHKRGEAVELDEISAEVSEAIDIATGVPRRPNKRGEKREPASERTKREVREAAEVSGNGKAQQRRVGGRGFSIAYSELPETTLGQVDVNGRRVCVQLNIRHPHIRLMREQRNMECLKTTAVALFCHHQSSTQDDGQRLMKFLEEHEQAKFGEACSRILGALAARSNPALEAIAE